MSATETSQKPMPWDAASEAPSVSATCKMRIKFSIFKRLIEVFHWGKKLRTNYNSGAIKAPIVLETYHETLRKIHRPCYQLQFCARYTFERNINFHCKCVVSPHCCWEGYYEMKLVKNVSCCSSFNDDIPSQDHRDRNKNKNTKNSVQSKLTKEK